VGFQFSWSRRRARPVTRSNQSLFSGQSRNETRRICKISASAVPACTLYASNLKQVSVRSSGNGMLRTQSRDEPPSRSRSILCSSFKMCLRQVFSAIETSPGFSQGWVKFQISFLGMTDWDAKPLTVQSPQEVWDWL